MKSKTQKRESLSKYKDKLAKAKIVLFSSFAKEKEKGVGVKDMQKLRSELKENDAEYLVEKKRLVSKALKDSGKDIEVLGYKGSLGTVFGYGDEASAARIIYQFSKGKPAVELFGGFLGNLYIDGDKALALAKLPSRDALIGQAVGMVSYPIRGLVNVLSANLRNLAIVLEQIRISKQ